MSPVLSAKGRTVIGMTAAATTVLAGMGYASSAGAVAKPNLGTVPAAIMVPAAAAHTSQAAPRATTTSKHAAAFGVATSNETVRTLITTSSSLSPFKVGVNLKSDPYMARVTGRATDWTGSFTNAADPAAYAYCPQPYKEYKAGTSHKGSVISGYSSLVQSQMKYVLNAHGNTNNAVQAEAVSNALRLLGDDAQHHFSRISYLFKVAQLGGPNGAMAKLVRQYLNEARLYHGEIGVKLVITNTLPGSTGRIIATVFSKATKHNVPGVKFSLVLRGASTVGHVPGNTNRNGQAVIGFFRTGLGAVAAALTATYPNPDAVFTTNPQNKRTNQVLLSAFHMRATTVKTSEHAHGGHAVITATCATDCTGNPNSTVSFVNQTGSVEILTASVNGHVLASTVIQPGHPAYQRFNTALNGQTLHVTVVEIINGHKVLVASGVEYIDCPPEPVVTYQGTCLCKGGQLVVNPITNRSVDLNWVSVTNSSSSARITIVIGGKSTTITSGAWIAIPAGTTSVAILDQFNGMPDTATVKTAERKHSGAVVAQPRFAVTQF